MSKLKYDTVTLAATVERISQAFEAMNKASDQAQQAARQAIAKLTSERDEAKEALRLSVLSIKELQVENERLTAQLADVSAELYAALQLGEPDYGN